jgi:hypothetical protein
MKRPSTGSLGWFAIGLFVGGVLATFVALTVRSPTESTLLTRSRCAKAKDTTRPPRQIQTTPTTGSYAIRSGDVPKPGGDLDIWA